MSEAVRVLHVNAGNLYGGVETYLSTLAESRSLVPSMVPEFALCFGGRQEDELKASGVPVHRLGEVRFSRPWTVWAARRNLKRLLMAKPFDVVVCHQPWIQALFGPLARKQGKGYVAYFHGPTGDHWLDRRARRTAPNLVTAPSQHSIDTVAEWFPGVPRQVVKYPLTAKLMQREAMGDAERAKLRGEFGAGPADVVIFQATRVESWKGPDLVLEALCQLRDVPNWRFWFAGGVQRPSERELFERMQRIAREGGIADRVRFLGERSDVPRLMQLVEIFTQGNRAAEGFGISFLEASYSGVPIVTTTLGGAGDMVDNRNGILVPPDDTRALAEAFRTLLIDPALRHSLGEAGRAKALLDCSPLGQMKLFNDAMVRTCLAPSVKRP